MVQPINAQYDHKKVPILGLVVETSVGAPASPVNGQMWYDTSTNLYMGRENGATIQLSRTGALVSGAAAGGDLTGTFPNPTIANLAVTAAKIASGTITDTQVAPANKDGVAGTASMRTLGTGAQQAMAGNTRLDQIPAPTASVGMNSQKITGLLDPSGPQDAATKNYVDGMATGLDFKASVRVASSANVTVTYNATGGTSNRGQLTAMPNTLDSVSLAAGNRVLLKNQTTGAQNGIWVVTTLGTGANGVWDRATDFDQDSEVTAGAFTFVEEGNTNGDTGWVLTTDNPITIGGSSGTALVFAQFSSAGTITAGNGLTKVSSVISAVGTAGRISVSGPGIDIDAAYVGQASITTLGTITTGVWNATAVAVGFGGTGASTAAGARTNLGAIGKFVSTPGTSWVAGTAKTINHNLNTSDVVPSFYDTTLGGGAQMEWAIVDANNITVTSQVALSASQIKVVVVG